MAGELWDSFSIKFTKQSLNERFSIYSVAFMRKCYERVFEQILLFSEAGQQTLYGFNRVILRDSTFFQLPATLSAHYEGNGGDTTGRVMKIQTEYDLLSGKIVRLDFRNGKKRNAARNNSEERLSVFKIIIIHILKITSSDILN